MKLKYRAAHDTSSPYWWFLSYVVRSRFELKFKENETLKLICKGGSAGLGGGRGIHLAKLNCSFYCVPPVIISLKTLSMTGPRRKLLSQIIQSGQIMTGFMITSYLHTKQLFKALVQTLISSWTAARDFNVFYNFRSVRTMLYVSICNVEAERCM